MGKSMCCIKCLFATGYLFLLTILVRMWQWRYGRIICQVPVKKGNASFCLLTIVFRETKINGLPANKANHRKTFIQMRLVTNTHLTLPRYKNTVSKRKEKEIKWKDRIYFACKGKEIILKGKNIFCLQSKTCVKANSIWPRGVKVLKFHYEKDSSSALQGYISGAWNIEVGWTNLQR